MVYYSRSYECGIGYNISNDPGYVSSEGGLEQEVQEALGDLRFYRKGKREGTIVFTRKKTVQRKLLKSYRYLDRNLGDPSPLDGRLPLTDQGVLGCLVSSRGVTGVSAGPRTRIDGDYHAPHPRKHKK